MSLIKKILQPILAFLIALSLLLLGEILLWQFMPTVAEDVFQYRHLFLYPEHLKPERQERQLFLFFVITILPLSWASARISRTLLPESNLDRINRKWGPWCVAGIALAFCIVEALAIVNSRIPHWLMPRGLTSPGLQLGYGCALFVCTAFIAMNYPNSSSPLHNRRHQLKWVILPFTSLTLLIAGCIFYASISVQTFSNDIWLLACTSIVAPVIAYRLKHMFLTGTPVDQQPVRWGPSLAFSVPIGLACISFICISFLRLKNINLVTTDPFIWTVHFEAIFYSFSQVIGGKTLLADLPSQYGLSAELMRPFFSVVGLTVGTFSLSMLLLQLIAQLALSVTIWRNIENSTIRLLGITMALMLTSGAWNYSSQLEVDAYYQYFPLRLVFPAVSVLIFSVWSEPLKSLSTTVVLGIWCGVAVAWNVDSGIPVFGTFFAQLLVSTIRSVPTLRTQWVRHLFIFSCTSAITLIVFFLYLEIKSGYRIDISSSLRYQDLFYRLGYFMLPMPTRLSPWMIVLGYYIYGLAQYFRVISNRAYERKMQLVFLLSILGIGLFAYYQGRSHELNLLSTLWPAAIISMLLFDQSVKAFALKKWRLTSALLSAPPLVFSTASLLVMVHTSAYVMPRTIPHLHRLLQTEKSPIIENIDFIKHTAQGYNEVAIISPHQAVYFAHTRLTSSIPGPGLVETVLVEDARRVIEKILNGKIRNLYIQTDDSIPPFYQRGELYQRYSVESESPAGLLHLVSTRDSK